MSNRACAKNREPPWKPIPGYTAYDASEDGKVRRAADRFELTPSKSRLREDGACYFTVSVVCPDGKRRNLYIHRLIALTFLGPWPDGAVVAHKDDNPANNHVSNLYYATPQTNAADAKRNGVRDRERRQQLLAQRNADMDAVRAEVFGNRPARRAPHSPPPGPPRMSLAPRFNAPADPDAPQLPPAATPIAAAG